MSRPNSLLYWKVCLINGAVLCAGALALVLSPVSVSRRVLLSEAVVVVIGLVVALALHAIVLRRAVGSQLAQSYEVMLDRAETDRQTSNAQLLATQEAERQRIAQELHDQIGQSLTVVLLGLKHLQSLVPANLHDDVALLRESARVGLDDVRRVARELRPGVLDDLGLHAALAALATDVAAHGGPSVHRRFGQGLPTLPPETEVVVYRIAQEALTNVLRHAQATRVELSLLRVGPHIVLEVSDDGVGVDDTVAAPPSAGLRGMRDRATLVNGRVEVTSAPGRGTTVRLSVPVDVEGPKP